MKNNFFKLSLLIAIGFATAIFSSCNQNEPEVCMECDEFCRYANVDDFYKTAPIINAHLEYLSKGDWIGGQKLLALVAWLNSKPCVISAEFTDVYLTSLPTNLITIWLEGATEKIVLYIGSTLPCESDLRVAIGYQYTRPRVVIATTQPFPATSTVFDFINLFDFEIQTLSNIFYSSATHSRDYILSNLDKPYIAGVGIAWPTGNQVFISPTFHSMDNKNYQADWLKFMADYQLFESVPFEHNSGAFITFLVPIGKENEWIDRFLSDYEFVISATRSLGFRSMRD